MAKTASIHSSKPKAPKKRRKWVYAQQSQTQPEEPKGNRTSRTPKQTTRLLTSVSVISLRPTRRLLTYPNNFTCNLHLLPHTLSLPRHHLINLTATRHRMSAVPIRTPRRQRIIVISTTFTAQPAVLFLAICVRSVAVLGRVGANRRVMYVVLGRARPGEGGVASGGAQRVCADVAAGALGYDFALPGAVAAVSWWMLVLEW